MDNKQLQAGLTRLGRALDGVLKTEQNLTLVQVRLLVTIGTQDSVTVPDLYRQQGASREALYERLNRLQEAGLLRVAARSTPKQYSLSAKGKRVLSKLAGATGK